MAYTVDASDQCDRTGDTHSYGGVGGICINIDANYLTEEVMNDAQKVCTFFEIFCRTDISHIPYFRIMFAPRRTRGGGQLDENILSPDEYQKALKGERHWRDDA